MKCLTNYKCTPYAQEFGHPKKEHFMCCGKPKIPFAYKKDVIRLCFAGKHMKDFYMEMTPEEAFMMISLLMRRLNRWIQNEKKTIQNKL